MQFKFFLTYALNQQHRRVWIVCMNPSSNVCFRFAYCNGINVLLHWSLTNRDAAWYVISVMSVCMYVCLSDSIPFESLELGS